MTKGGLFLCHARGMRDDEQTYGVELLLQEPEIVAWLNDYRRLQMDQMGPDEAEDDDDPPEAA